jgi:hypothetical protein
MILHNTERHIPVTNSSNESGASVSPQRESNDTQADLINIDNITDDMYNSQAEIDIELSTFFPFPSDEEPSSSAPAT